MTDVKVRILRKAPYTRPGTWPLRAIELDRGALFEFPIAYAEAIVASGMAEYADDEEVKAKVEKKTVTIAEVNASQTAIALAEEHGINLADVAGTGEDGRILVGDVRALIPKSEGESG